MTKLLATLFFLTAIVNAASNPESCYTIELSNGSKAKIDNSLNREKYPKECKIITLKETQRVQCGCFKNHKDAEKYLEKLKKSYTNATITQIEKKDSLSLQAVVVRDTPKKITRYQSNKGLSLDDALEVLKSQNLEIKAAKLDLQVAKANEGVASGMNWGKLTFQQDIARSNDAGNVFGFKLTSREATFGDFGFSEFSNTNPNILQVQPKDLNYPGYRNLFQTKLKYEVPLFTGFAISSYEEIMKEMSKMKKLEKDKVANEKIYQLRKSYYDVALLDTSIKHLDIVLNNINTLEDTTKTMISVGYAKKVDLLEVEAKKGNVERLLVQMRANKELLLQYISFLLNKKVTEIQTPAFDVPMPQYSDSKILKTNLDIQRAATGLEIRKSMQSAAKSAFYPTVGAFGEVATADDTFLGDASDHKAYTIGARVSWNLFNGGTDASKLEKAKLEHLKMSSQLQLAKEGIRLKLAKIRTKITSINVEIASLKKELDLANTIYENYEYRYKEKLVSMSDVIIKQSLQIEKILQLQQAKNKRIETVFALEKLANGEK